MLALACLRNINLSMRDALSYCLASEEKLFNISVKKLVFSQRPRSSNSDVNSDFKREIHFDLIPERSWQKNCWEYLYFSTTITQSYARRTRTPRPTTWIRNAFISWATKATKDGENKSPFWHMKFRKMQKCYRCITISRRSKNSLIMHRNE